MTGIRGMSGQPAANNAGWMRLAVAEDLNIQLHSVWQPPQWKNHSRNYWTRIFEGQDTDPFIYPVGREIDA